MKPVIVHVALYGRANFYMRYHDPETGRDIVRSTGQKNRKAAEKVAAKWEAEINEGRYTQPSRTHWNVFRQRYETEVLPGLKRTSRIKSFTVLSRFEEFARPSSLVGITPATLSRFVKKIRDDGRSESTILGYLATLRAALQWAVDAELLLKLPRFPKIQRAKRTNSGTPLKGRPLTEEEFSQLCEHATSDSWRFYLRGLWLSGLRLEESLDLWWDRTDRLHVIMGDRPLLSISAEHEKGHRDRLLPITPDFAEFLKAVPPSQRTGRVFKPYDSESPSKFNVSERISEFGKAAKIIVNSRSKFASAHDLRRSFGERWAMRVMPQLLMQLMRHSSIETTMRFYVGRNALAVSDMLYELAAKEKRDSEAKQTPKKRKNCNTPRNSSRKRAKPKEMKKPQT